MSSSISGCQSTPTAKRFAGILEPLERAVLGPRGLDEPLPDAADALVVARLDAVVPRAEDPGEPRALLHVDRVLREHAERLAMTLVPDLLGQVLDEVAAASDVQQLEAAADRERRQVALERAREQRELAGVAVGLRRIGRRVTLGAVGRGVDVDAAGEDDPVEHVERVVDVLVRRAARRAPGRRPARPTRRSRAARAPPAAPTRPSARAARTR